MKKHAENLEICAIILLEIPFHKGLNERYYIFIANYI